MIYVRGPNNVLPVDLMILALVTILSELSENNGCIIVIKGLQK